MTPRAWLAAGIMLWPAGSLAAQELPRVMIQTELGSMEVEVDTVGNPDAAGNFLTQVDQGAYQGSRFYRTIRAERVPGGKAEIEGIQGGLNPSRPKDAPPMVLERKKDTGLSLGDRPLSINGDGPGASASEFFIRAGDQPELGGIDPDGQGFIPFGRVVRGREVVRLIQTARAKDQRLTPPVTIISITRVR
jgi:peptidyl-prolyl cis-trans isomerase A (cyclophilin A)